MSNLIRISYLRWTKDVRRLSLARRYCSHPPKHYQNDGVSATNRPQSFEKISSVARRATTVASQNLSDKTLKSAKAKQNESADFFGFDGHGDVVATGHVEGSADRQSSLAKYRSLFTKAPPEEPEEKTFTTSFGCVRYDTDNRPRYRSTRKDAAESQPDMLEQTLEPRIPTGSGCVDEQYFGSFMGGAARTDEQAEIDEQQSGQDSSELDKIVESSNFIDEQYFAGATEIIEQLNRAKLEQSPDISSNSQHSAEKSESGNYIDDQYFGTYLAGAKEINDQLERSADEQKAMVSSSCSDQVVPSITKIIEQLNRAKLEQSPDISSNSQHSAEESESGRYIDDQYFGTYLAGAKKINDQLERSADEQKAMVSSSSSDQVVPSTTNFIDEQYFQTYYAGTSLMREQINLEKIHPINEILDNIPKQHTLNKIPRNQAEPDSEQLNPSNYFEEPYFENNFESALEERSKIARTLTDQQRPVRVVEKALITRDSGLTKHSSEKEAKSARSPRVERNLETNDGNEFGRGLERPTLADDEPETRNTEKYRERLAGVDLENPKTAYDYVMKQRVQASSGEQVSDGNDRPVSNTKLDSKGFKILKDQVHDLEREPEMVVLQILKESILYNEQDIVAISKPYGLLSHGGAGHHHSIDKFLPDLAKWVSGRGTSPPCERLHLVHRLDRDTTGVLLLAKTPHMAQLLHSMLARHQLRKTYLCVTKNVPHPPEGVIDIPMAEALVEGASRMVLRPVRDEDTKLVTRSGGGRRSYRAITAYRVLASEGHAALVELKPETGVQHQLRVHMAYGLGCPVLGDHKYSHLSKVAPQKLPSDILERLGIRQSKVRHLAMHLHARSVSIPGVLEGRDIAIGANLPSHFTKNMRSLKLKYP